MESLTPFLIQLATGAVGGSIIGALLQKISLGRLSNMAAGIIGAGAFGSLISDALNSGVLGDIVGAALGGSGFMLIAGLIVSLFKSQPNRVRS